MKRRGTYCCIAAFVLFFFTNCTNNHQSKYELIDREQEIVAMGKKLFFDSRLSSDNTISCASCHQPRIAFSDGRKLGIGVGGRNSARNVPSLWNVKFQDRFMFDGEIKTLERQVLVPLLDHAEMNADLPKLFKKLSKDSYYIKQSKILFNRPFDSYVLTRSIARYEKTLTAMNSRFDQFLAGDNSKLTKQEQLGFRIFKSLYCIQCHQPPRFTKSGTENNGLYFDYGEDQGRFRVTEKDTDKGKFKIPSLRNTELTAPYMHDGSIKTLLEVVRHYEKGGEHHPNQSIIIQPFHLSSEEETNLVLFLKSLTDNSGKH